MSSPKKTILQVLHQKTSTMIAWLSDLHKMITQFHSLHISWSCMCVCACQKLGGQNKYKCHLILPVFISYIYIYFNTILQRKTMELRNKNGFFQGRTISKSWCKNEPESACWLCSKVVQLFERKRVTQFNVMNMDQNRWESSMHIFQSLEIKSRIIILSTRKVLPQLFSTQSHRFSGGIGAPSASAHMAWPFFGGHKKQDLSWAMLRFQVCRKLFHWFFSVHSKAVTWVLVNEMMKRYQKQEVWFKWGVYLTVSYILYEECMSCTAVYDMFLRFWNHMEVQDLHSVSNTEKITMDSSIYI